MSVQTFVDLLEEEMAARSWTPRDVAIRLVWEQFQIEQLALELLLACRDQPNVVIASETLNQYAKVFGVSAELFHNLYKSTDGVPVSAPALPAETKCVGAHKWSFDHDDDSLPTIGTPCDCRLKQWAIPSPPASAPQPEDLSTGDLGERYDKLLASWDERWQRLRTTEHALRILRDSMGGHQHWDREGTNGVNCPICITQREARGRVDTMLAALPAIAPAPQEEQP